MEHPLRRPLHAREHQVHVEAEEGELPLGRDDLDRERLSAPGHAHQQHALGAREVLGERLGREQAGAVPHPGLELVEPADVAHPTVGGDELQDPLLAHHLLLLGQHLRHERLVHPLVACQQPVQQVLHLEQAHPAQRADQQGQPVALGCAAGLLQHGADRRGDLPLVREQRRHDVAKRLQLVGDLQRRPEQENEAAGVPDRGGGVAQAAQQPAVAGQERVDVLEDVEALRPVRGHPGQGRRPGRGCRPARRTRPGSSTPRRAAPEASRRRRSAAAASRSCPPRARAPRSGGRRSRAPWRLAQRSWPYLNCT